MHLGVGMGSRNPDGMQNGHGSANGSHSNSNGMRPPAGNSNKVTVVLGAQWGDEGKGKLVDMLATDTDVVCRCQVRWEIFILRSDNNENAYTSQSQD